MRKILALVLALVFAVSLFGFAYAEKHIVIAVPNDTTNYARALFLLESMGVIKMKDGADIKATADDIAENPLGIEFYAVEAAMVPNVLADVDYAIINNNYALDAGLISQSLFFENSDSPYCNVVCVNAGNESSELAKALAAAVNSKQVADFINANYDGAAISVVENPTDGYDAMVDYEALKGSVIEIAVSPVPHAQIMAVVKDILAEKEIELVIREFSDYIQPNFVVDSGEMFANYFAHQPYQDDFNAENGTKLVTIASVHVEPMGIYGGKQADLSVLEVE